MGWLRGKWMAVAGVMLVCAVVASAQTTRPAASIPQGKYEEEAVVQGGTTAGSRAPASQPAISTATPGLDTGRVVLALGIVLGLIFAMRWAGRKYFPGAGVPRSSGTMKILTRLVISPKQQLLMIQVGRRIVVVGDANGQMSALSEITDPDEAATLLLQLAEEKSQHSAKGFGALFNRAETTFDEKAVPIEPADQIPEKPTVADSPSAEDPAIRDARGELDELADKVRMLSAQFSGK